MAKKNPYVFTIGFDETDPVHVRAVEILNGTKKKAQLIAIAILNYIDAVDSKRDSNFHVESFRPFLEKMIQKELEKMMQEQKEFNGKKNLKKDYDQILNLSSEEENITMDENITQNIVDAMEGFRKNK